MLTATCDRVGQRRSRVVQFSLWHDPLAGAGERTARHARCRLGMSCGACDGRASMQVHVVPPRAWRSETCQDQDFCRCRRPSSRKRLLWRLRSECRRLDGIFSATNTLRDHMRLIRCDAFGHQEGLVSLSFRHGFHWRQLWTSTDARLRRG